MTSQELCMLLEFIVAMIESGNTDKALEIIKKRIDDINRKKPKKDNND